MRGAVCERGQVAPVGCVLRVGPLPSVQGVTKGSAHPAGLCWGVFPGLSLLPAGLRGWAFALR